MDFIVPIIPRRYDRFPEAGPAVVRQLAPGVRRSAAEGNAPSGVAFRHRNASGRYRPRALK
jgi:hypothetical protein